MSKRFNMDKIWWFTVMRRQRIFIFFIIDYYFSILIFIIPFLLNCTFDVFNFFFFFFWYNNSFTFFFFVYTLVTLNSVQKLLSLNDVVGGHVNQKNCYVLYYTQVVVWLILSVFHRSSTLCLCLCFESEQARRTLERDINTCVKRCLGFDSDLIKKSKEYYYM